MATNKMQETLDRLLEELKSSDSARCLQALEELHSLRFSSPAILRELERLAIRHRDKDVRKQASEALGTSVQRFVRKEINTLNRGDRAFVLRQIEMWEQDGLLPAHIAHVISARYDFDVGTPRVPSTPAPVTEKPAPERPAVPKPVISAEGPPASLTQTLLSEASIRVYLYLGAFFVIAAAFILAALVEAARLPILGAAILLFGGAALSLRRRLPQPSFALFIVFSFLLPIGANVFEETFGFREPSLSIYWTILFLIMAIIWGFSVWLYESRFFSAVAFVSLSLAFYRAAQIFSSRAEAQIFLGMLASLAGLAGTIALTTWKDTRFSRFVFLLAQVQVVGLLFVSLALALVEVFNGDLANRWWLFTALTWLAAAVFFFLSDQLAPFALFPWMAAAALLPLPWFFLNVFETEQPVYAIGFFAWGAILALGSEAALRVPLGPARKYHWALLAASALLFLTSFTIVSDWGAAGLSLGIFALTALVYGGLHLLRPRWYVWGAALLSMLGAYLQIFKMPSIEQLDIPFLYQWLLISILLVVPELFTRSPLSYRSETRWPALVFGTFVSVLGITIALTDTTTGRGALALLVYAALFTLHAFHSQRAWLGYFATALESLALVYALDYFNLDLWLPALTALSILYYAAGFFFRRRDDALKAWGNVFVDSALALGVLLSLVSLALTEETSGWYILLVAGMFAVEIFARPFAWFELAVEILLSISLYLILADFHVARIGHFLFGASLVWLGGDLLFGRLIDGKRRHRPIVLGAGFILTAMSTLVLFDGTDPAAATIYFALYSAFFAAYAFLQREPMLGYLGTAFLSLAVFKFCDFLGFGKWIFPLIVLAGIYYLSGYWLRRRQAFQGWGEVLLYSGLGLGVITSFGAPPQPGLDTSIPVAIAATLFAVEAFARRDVWWALPADLLYLMSYFVLLTELKVEEPQFYSIGAALLGMLMHNLLTRAGSKTGAFVAGMLSQLVLLGTTYIQMVSTEKLSFFFVLFAQSLIVLVYGLIQRSRSLVITPIAFAVIGVMTVVYSALKGLGPVILIGSTGVLLLMAGIVAVLMRERITRLGEQLSEWKP